MRPRALAEVDLYLKEWLGESGKYHLVEDAEQFFNDLARALVGKEGDALEARRRIAWGLISRSKELKNRVYSYNFSFDRQTDDVVASLCSRLNLNAPGADENEAEDAGGDDEDIEVDIDYEESNGPSFDAVIRAFDDPSQRDEVVSELIAVCDSLRERQRQGKAGRRALESVQAANRHLQEVDLSKADPVTYESLERQLRSVSDRATKLIDIVSVSRRV